MITHNKGGRNSQSDRNLASRGAFGKTFLRLPGAPALHPGHSIGDVECVRYANE